MRMKNKRDSNASSADLLKAANTLCLSPLFLGYPARVKKPKPWERAHDKEAISLIVFLILACEKVGAAGILEQAQKRQSRARARHGLQKYGQIVNLVGIDTQCGQVWQLQIGRHGIVGQLIAIYHERFERYPALDKCQAPTKRKAR
jgi:hypothetical protein